MAADLRTSQAERDHVVDALRSHAGEGRLDVEELEQRVERALAAWTRAELEPLLADLPALPGPRPPMWARARPAVLAVAPVLVALLILVLAPAGMAWVGWTVLGWWFFAGPAGGALGLSCASRRHRHRPRLS